MSTTSPAACSVLDVQLAWPATLRVRLTEPMASLQARLRFWQDGAGPTRLIELQLTPVQWCGRVWLQGSWSPPGPALQRIDLSTGAAGAIAMAEDLAHRLAHLYAQDDAAYDELFPQQRWTDESSQFFLSDQICTLYAGSPVYRCISAVVCAYKAAELGDPALLRQARRHLDLGESWLTSLPPSRQPRHNPAHLRASMDAARWHVDLAANDPQVFAQTLDRAEANLSNTHDYFTVAVPAARSMVLLGWWRWKTGQVDDAVRAWTLATDLYRWAVRDANPTSLALYAELRDTQDSAIIAARGLALAAGRRSPQSPIDSVIVLGRALRVTGAPAVRLINQALNWWGEPLCDPLDFQS